MIVWGTLVTQRRSAVRAPRSRADCGAWPALGIALALYVFMADALRVVHQGVDATRTVLPTAFNWSVFVVALALMAAPVAHLTRDAGD